MMDEDALTRHLALKINKDTNMPAGILLLKAVLGTVAGVAATVAVNALVDQQIDRKTKDIVDSNESENPEE